MAGLLLAVGPAGCGTLWPGHSERPVGPGVAVDEALEPKWTITTWEAVSTPAHRKALERGHPATLTGEVVDVSCFLQLGKRGEAHVPCGQKCVRHGEPVGVVTDNGRLYLIMAEEHHPRRDGEVRLRERFAELMGQRVRVSGMVTEYEHYRALFVRTLEREL